MVNEITPKYDSTLGLIFRLNNLWAKVDIPAETGKYEEWNNVLDRIYNNLAYRAKTKVDKDKDGKILGIRVDDPDNDEYLYLSRKVNACKQMFIKVQGVNKKGISKKKIARSMWYKTLTEKDIWLRRFMHKLNLYIKETTKTPGTVMWGRKR